MTELENYIIRKKVSTYGRVCSIANQIKTKDDDCCIDHNCWECDFCNSKDEILKILLSEHKEKPQLTDGEKAILRSIDKEYKYIARDRNGNLFVYKKKPHKKHDVWINGSSVKLLDIFNHLFQSIKGEDEEPCFIPDLLEDQPMREHD